jgi:hypothetical protein
MDYFKGILVLMVAALLLGCPGETPPATAPPADGGAAPGPADGGAVPDDTGGGGAVPDDTTGGGSAATGDASDEFESLFANVASVEYKVSYETTISSEGETFTSTSTMTLKGQKMRTDSYVEYAGETSQSSTYILEDGLYICTYDPQATCMKFGTSEDYEESETGALADEVESNPGDYDIYNRPSRTIAGINAKCFGFSGADLEGDFEVCYSSEGVMLYLHYAFEDNEYTTIATSAQIGSVSDSEFVLPAEPMDLEDIMGDYYDIDVSGYT